MLGDQIESAKRSVNTDTVQITVGEVATMYKDRELDIIPDFQRLFRWSIDKKSSFIESILIGIPIPSVFVYENEDGTWELIDGLQRISTILEFMGVLKDPDTGAAGRSVLAPTKYLKALGGIAWVAAGHDEKTLDKPFQLFFRRHRIDFQILKHPSDPSTKYDLFQRLNRGGAYANEQEVRTCSMVLANSLFTERLRSFSAQDDFQKIFRITPDQHKTQKDLEYAVRLLVHSYEELPPRMDVQEFLDQAVLKVMEEQDIEKAMKKISWSVSILFNLFGEKALLPTENRHSDIEIRFSLRALEGMAVGISRNHEAIAAHNDAEGFVRDRVKNFWVQQEVADMSASGLRGTMRIQRSVPFGVKWFNPNG